SLGLVALQRDLGCALILFLVLAVMLANSSENGWVYLAALAVAGIALAVIAYHGFGHVRQRFDVWLNPLADPDGLGYQYRMAMSCIANGGLLGCGLGNGLHFAHLPVADSDYIFPVLCEELGLIGCAVVLGCYAGIAREASRCASALPRSSFERNLVAAVGALISVEALIIVAGTLNLIPMTGVVLPLVSRGGSSFLATCAALGLMVGASCSAKSESRAGAESSFEVTAPRVMTAGACAALAACMLTTGSAQIQAGEFPRICGVTAHENLRGSIVTLDGAVLAVDRKVADGSASAGGADSADGSASAGGADSADGAGSTTENDAGSSVVRVYPQGTLACHVVGALSDGVEARFDLTGDSALANVLAIPEQGEGVMLTLHSRIQAKAEELLAGCTGAMVAIDPETGRILAAASTPVYPLAGDSSEWEAIARDSSEQGALAQSLAGQASASQGSTASDISYVNRAFSGQYAPGSTFKLVTLAAALEQGVVAPQVMVDSPATVAYGQSQVVNYRQQSFGALPLAQATNYSVNTAFASIGTTVGAEGLTSMAENLGFNGGWKLEVGSLDSTIGSLSDPLALAWASCGEQQAGAKLLVTPLQMAMVMCAVCNDGVVMHPYVVEGRVTGSGKVVQKTKPRPLSTAFSSETARSIVGILEQNDVEHSGCPYWFIGKSGTAQNELAADNAWYVCASELDGRKVVVACVVEQGGMGADAALPRAASLAAAALEEQGW
ncbi:MAG: FtsW/RodA/SpoVE family cell cycle protein, partial [Eggerthellaceae bacterium]|nr:FtsW/RodA/SpoVE family cell cycle protein [Eggerthellaceae bacterium]